MEIIKSSIVIAKAGRDKGKLFVVLDVMGDYAYIADGKSRKIEKPKKKKIKHLSFFNNNETRLGDDLLSGEKITNAKIRKCLQSVVSAYGLE